MINFKESEKLELKESLTQLKRAVVSISAILNKHKKGKIIFGVNDDGEVKGVSIGKNTLREISKTISDHIEPKIYPDIKEERIKNKTCISVDFYGDDVPYFAYGRAYKRIADENKHMAKAELEKIIIYNNMSKTKWDVKTNVKFSLKDISEKKLKDYISQVGVKFTTKEDVLQKLELIRDEKLTNASIILFGKNPSSYFQLLNLRCAVFAGSDKSSQFIDMKDFSGDIFYLIEYAQQYILQHIDFGMKIDGLKRIDVPEINKEAMREAIINAFCHRDYSIPQEVQIAIFRDRVEILNPGRLYGGLKVNDILSRPVSQRRNELIADIFHRVHFVEKWGTGIGKIKSLESQTKFEEVSNFFMVTFKRKSVPPDIPPNSPQTYLSQLEAEILDLIKKDKSISRRRIAKIMDKSEDTIKEYLDRLKKKKVLERIGTYKGEWIIKD